jgi:hypothetical protein
MSFTSTYSSLSDRGWQSADGSQQFYSQIASQYGPIANNSSAFGLYSDISDISPNISGLYNLTVTSRNYNNSSDFARLYTTEFNGIKQTFNGLSNVLGISFGSFNKISNDGNYIAATGNTSAGLNQANLVIYSADTNYDFTLQTTILSPHANSDYRQTRTFNSDATLLAQQARGVNLVDIYTRSGNIWSLGTSIAPTDGNIPSAGFGISLSYSSNNTLASGAGGTVGVPGTVFIFTGNTQVARIFPSTSSSDDAFGQTCNISADGNYLAVGARNVDKAFVFANVANVWTEIAILTPTSNTLTTSAFGSEVVISNNGNTVVVSDPSAKNTVTNVNRGALYIFTKDGNNYVQTQEILNPEGTTSISGVFGTSLSMTTDGKRIVASDPSRRSGNLITGALYLFQSFT